MEVRENRPVNHRRYLPLAGFNVSFKNKARRRCDLRKGRRVG